MLKQGKANRLAHDLTHRGVTAWLLSAALFAFYLALYFTEGFTGVARALGLPDKWTLYGLLYTLAILAGGVHVLRKYRHNRYQVVRTAVVMFVQVTLAFAVPQILKFFHQPEYYFSYLWPLKLEDLTPGIVFQLPLPYILYSFLAALLLAPALAALFGKRWYCSWVCGCGGLANTAGDPLRHLTSKSSAAWKFEKVAIHTVLAVCVTLTALLFVTWGLGSRHPRLSAFTYHFQSLYGLVVVAMLSGVIGVGLYPIGGTRVWCRNFCPMAALLGLVQKIGRYRITVKQNMCISCGLCSKYCEMGIDVRAYAQANTSFTRASCVGCGLCAEVCPRGVLRLENTATKAPQEFVLVRISGVR
ncbi:MAG TPA: 4Fe-4S dicluster domain-containing protein [Bryobacteraceae bacterium]|nr:4Fe-4S dicluster domain-containing protein [Bryobacteraceae bacterium]